MPEFVMPVSNYRDWENLSPFVQGFIEAAFFTETACFTMEEWFTPEAQHAIAEGQSDGNIPSDCETRHIHPDSLAKIVTFCEAFQARAADLLSRAYARDYDEAQAGRDLLFTHCGHGVGYWERDALKPDDAEYEALTAEMVANRDNPAAWQAALDKRRGLEGESLGHKLSEAAGRGEVNPFFGDHITHGNAPFLHFEIY